MCLNYPQTIPTPVCGKIVFHETLVPKSLGTNGLEEYFHL